MRNLLTTAVIGGFLAASTAGAALVITAPALAKKDESPGIMLEIQVVDAESEQPIKTAKIRNPQEKEPHSVNIDDGVWKGDVLYLPDGTEVFFEKGMNLTFEISAPSYTTEKRTYTMRKRNNRIIVPLAKMSLDIDDLMEDDPVIQFGRDKPIGGRDIE
ncbi:MAG: hypothetical protein AB8H79_07690 [Myxococcota bacterium]